MIRLREIEKWLRYRGRVENAWQLATARRRAPRGSPLSLAIPEVGTCTIRAGTTDHRVFDEVFIRDAYRLSSRSGEPRLGTVVDGGAHIGIFAIRAARVAERVICLEPVAENRRLLEANLRSTGAANVTVLPYALGDCDGEATIHHAGHQAGHSLFPELSGTANGGGETVPMRRLETLLDELAIPRVDLLKLDCEGAEYPVLLGADDATLGRIERIRLEFHDLGPGRGERSGAALAARLAAAGFRVTTVASKRSPERGMLWATRTGDE